MRRSLLRLLVILPLMSVLSGCGIIDYFYLPPPEDTAQEIFEIANDAMRDKNYVQAKKYFTTLKDKYPFSPYAIEAELSLADAYYLDGDYVLAADAYKEFESLHPRHKAIPYVLFQIGQADLDSFISLDRPQDNIAEGYEYLKRLQESHPGTEYAEKAKPLMLRARKLMAGHEIYVADFYFRRENYGSAYERYKFVIKQFPDVTEYQAYATERARISYLKKTEQEAEMLREDREGSWRDYFDWL